MGKDVASQVQNIINEADYIEKRLETDLDAYESQLDSFNSMCRDVLDVIGQLIQYIENSKKLDRKHIIQSLNNAKKLIENEI
ncbi:MAG: hypothetical protein Kow00111_25780 [Thermincola ferriacetica]